MDRIAETDAKGRISLGVKYADQRFIVEKEDCELILRQAVVIPERELWTYQNPEARRRISLGIEQARKGDFYEGQIDLDCLDEGIE